jgi:transcriptional regulator with XRE-family HTH domain
MGYTKEQIVRFIAARKTKGMLQEDLARVLGVTSRTVSNWESGNTLPSGEKLDAWAVAVGLDAIATEGEATDAEPDRD